MRFLPLYSLTSTVTGSISLLEYDERRSAEFQQGRCREDSRALEAVRKSRVTDYQFAATRCESGQCNSQLPLRGKNRSQELAQIFQCRSLVSRVLPISYTFMAGSREKPLPLLPL